MGPNKFCRFAQRLLISSYVRCLQASPRPWAEQQYTSKEQNSGADSLLDQRPIGLIRMHVKNNSEEASSAQMGAGKSVRRHAPNHLQGPVLG